MNMSDGKNEKGGCEGGLIVVRLEGEEIWLVLDHVCLHGDR